MHDIVGYLIFIALIGISYRLHQIVAVLNELVK
jgi:hypothetical protein